MNLGIRILKWFLISYRNNLSKIKSICFSRSIDLGMGKIKFSDPYIKLKIKKKSEAIFHLEGILNITSHLGGKGEATIIIGKNARLDILNDFSIGQNTQIYIADNAILSIVGKLKSSGAGITCDTKIMVYKNVSIGADFICDWNVFISDSDWHSIKNQNHHKDVIIGDNVWIANSYSILKGSIIGSGCIVASHSKTGNKEYPSNSLIGGTNGTVLKSNISWNRDLD